MPQEVWNEISKVTSGYRQGIKSECDQIQPDFSAVPELKLGTHIKTEFKCVNVWIYAGCVSRAGCQQIEILNCGIHIGSSSVLMFPGLKPVWYLGLTPVTLWFARGRQTDKVCIVLQTSHISDSLVSNSQNLWVFYLHATCLVLCFFTHHEVHSPSVLWPMIWMCVLFSVCRFQAAVVFLSVLSCHASFSTSKRLWNENYIELY